MSKSSIQSYIALQYYAGCLSLTKASANYPLTACNALTNSFETRVVAHLYPNGCTLAALLGAFGVEAVSGVIGDVAGLPASTYCIAPLLLLAGSSMLLEPVVAVC